MKNIILPVFLLLMLVTSCREKNDLINLKDDTTTGPGPNNPDTTGGGPKDSVLAESDIPAAQQKHVLIEDFTGVKCVNCPVAQDEAKKIAGNHPGRVAVVSIHATAFANPYAESNYDFRTDDGTNLLALLGSPVALPIGAIDRKIYPGGSSPLVSYTQWGTYVNQQLALSTPVNVEIVSATAANNQLEVKVRCIYTEKVDTAHFLSLMLTESEIVDMQLTPSGKDPNYVHNHALRKIFPVYNGQKLDDDFQKGRVIEKTFTTTLDASWKVDKLHVVAVVHRRGQDKQDVVQVAEAEVK